MIKELPEVWCIPQNMSEEVCAWFANHDNTRNADQKGRWQYLVYNKDRTYFSDVPVGTILTIKEFKWLVLRIFPKKWYIKVDDYNKNTLMNWRKTLKDNSFDKPLKYMNYQGTYLDSIWEYDLDYLGCVEISFKDFLDNVYSNAIKASELISGNWYKVTSISGNVFLFEFLEMKENAIYSNKYYCFTNHLISETVAYLIDMFECAKIEPADNQEVHKYFPEKWNPGTYAVAVKGYFGIFNSENDSSKRLIPGTIFTIEKDSGEGVYVVESTYWIKKKNLIWAKTIQEAERIVSVLEGDYPKKFHIAYGKFAYPESNTEKPDSPELELEKCDTVDICAGQKSFLDNPALILIDVPKI